MSFTAMASWQAWLLMTAAVAAAVWVFLIKVRPPRLQVPTMLLWQRVFDEVRERSWWDRVRRAVSLVMTALIALALAIGVTRPGPKTTEGVRGRLVIVLDSSWSMRAKMVGGGTRWDLAVAEARTLAHAAGSEDVAVATTADGLVEGPTSDLALIDVALDRLAPSGGEGTEWPRVEGARSVHFFTDGALVRPLDPNTVIHSVYEPAPNVAITAMSARPSLLPQTKAQAYLEVTNYAEKAQTVRMTVRRDRAVLIDKRVEMAPGAAIRQTVALEPQGGARLQAHISAPANALDVDDDAVAWLADGNAVSVTVVTDTPQVWARLFERDANVRATFVRPADYRPIQTDVGIFDKWLPAEAPPYPVLALVPVPVSWLGEVSTEETDPQLIPPPPHRVLEGVDTATLDIKRAQGYVSPDLARVAVSVRDTPLVSVRDTPTRRAVVLGFGVGDSNLASALAFPVLIQNAIEWLVRPVDPGPRRPGPVELPVGTTRVADPQGVDVPLVRAADRVLATLRAPGFFVVEGGGSMSVVGVNVGSPDSANLRHTTLPPDMPRPQAAGYASRPWWLYAVVLALLFVSVEWWTWQRRVTV